MRIVKILALVAVSIVATSGLASAQSVSQGGTPDAKGGAIGRDQPTSLNGRGVRRSAGLTPRVMMKRHHYRYHRRHAM